MSRGKLVRLRRVAGFLAGALVVIQSSQIVAQTYQPPAPGDFGGAGAFSVSVLTFTNPVYPAANGQPLVVSVFHPGTTINAALPTIFFAHGFTSPVGSADNYLNILNHLASRGYNVVFSPYEGGVGLNIPQRFDELVTGFNAAVTNFSLNTAQVGFTGHSYGGGFLTAVVLHEMMGKASNFRAGHSWGGTAAFFHALAPGYAYSGGGQTDVAATQTIFFPTNLNVVEQAFNDDTNICDPRVAMDVFYNCTTLNSQKDFYITYGDAHGTNSVTANHFLPNAYTNSDVPLQAWAILRRLDALAAWTFTGDTNARPIALGNRAAAQTYEGAWSDAVPVAALGVTDMPNPNSFPTSYVSVNWSSAVNPRKNFPLFSGQPGIANVRATNGQTLLLVTNLLANHSYIEQQSPALTSASWTNAISFTPTNSSMTLTNQNTTSPNQFWRILVP
jgi:hypothetical protein